MYLVKQKWVAKGGVANNRIETKTVIKTRQNILITGFIEQFDQLCNFIGYKFWPTDFVGVFSHNSISMCKAYMLNAKTVHIDIHSIAEQT